MSHIRPNGGWRLFRFTMVELLVVISIIMILSALLLPALGAARDRAKSIACMGKLKQFGSGMIMYVDDNGVFPAYGTAVNYSCWDIMMMSYVNYSREHPTGIFHCPASQVYTGSIYTYEKNSRGYAMNSNVAAASTSPALRKLGLVRRDPEILLLVDYWIPDLDCLESNVGGNINNSEYITCAPVKIPYMGYRHSNGFNYLRKDGAVKHSSKGSTGFGPEPLWTHYDQNYATASQRDTYWQDGNIVH